MILFLSCQTNQTNKLVQTLQHWIKPLQACFVQTQSTNCDGLVIMVIIWRSVDMWGIPNFNGHNILTHKYFSYITPDIQKLQNITIWLRKHGKKALHGLVYIKGHVHTLDLKCPAWGTLIRNIQFATVQDWKSNKGSYGKFITTASVPLSGGLKEAIKKYW